MKTDDLYKNPKDYFELYEEQDDSYYFAKSSKFNLAVVGFICFLLASLITVRDFFTQKKYAILRALMLCAGVGVMISIVLSIAVFIWMEN